MISILTAARKEAICTFFITTSTITKTKRILYNIFQVVVIIEKAATSSKSSAEYLHDSVACIKIFRNS